MRKLTRKLKRLFRRLARWLRRPNLTQLREFVYLDEVSVVSLSSSLRGALAEEITDSESSTLKTDSKFELGTRVPYLKSKTGYGAEFSTSEGRQILRKSTIQSKYKDLMVDLSSRLNTLHYTQSIAAPSDPAKLLIEIEEWKPEDKIAWLKSADDFVRGDLVEFEVELAADVVYGAGLTLSSMAGVLKRIGQVDQSVLSDVTIDQLQVLSEVLTQLLIGLIPMKSKIVGWKVLEFRNKTFLVTDDVASKLNDKEEVIISAVFITGVIEETLFWKDVRQVLFNNYKMKVLCRLTEPMSKEWNPIKMFDVLTSIMPSMPEELLSLSNGKWLQNGLAQGIETQPSSVDTQGFNPKVIAQKYIDIIVIEEGIKLSAKKKGAIVIAATNELSDNSYASMVNILKLVDENIKKELSIDMDTDKLVLYRTMAIASPEINDEDVMKKIEEYVETESAKEYYINAEVISIYW